MATQTPIPPATATASLPTPTFTPEPQVLLDQVESAWSGEDWPRVVDLLDQLKTRAPDAMDYTTKLYVAHFNAGMALLAKGDKATAALEFSQADRTDPSRGEAHEQILALTPTPLPTMTPTLAPSPTPAPTPTLAPGVGAVLVTGDYALVVSEVSFMPRIGYTTAQSGHEFALVGVNIKNLGHGTNTFNLFQFKLQDSSGVIRHPSFVVGLDNQLDSGEFASGATVTGWVPFEITARDRHLTLIYGPCLLFCSDLRVPLP